VLNFSFVNCHSEKRTFQKGIPCTKPRLFDVFWREGMNVKERLRKPAEVAHD